MDPGSGGADAPAAGPYAAIDAALAVLIMRYGEARCRKAAQSRSGILESLRMRLIVGPA